MAHSDDRHDDLLEPSRDKVKVPLVPLSGRVHNSTTRKSRKKTVEACEQCREKRVKCDGHKPCGGCYKRGYDCSFNVDSQENNDQMMGMMSQILSRLERFEALVQPNSEELPSPRRIGNHSLIAAKPVFSSVTEFNQRTHSFEYYGTTSNFAIAKSLDKRVNQLEKEMDDVTSSHSTRRQTAKQVQQSPRSSSNIHGLETLLDTHDFVTPPDTSMQHCTQSIQKDVADRHLASFFDTIHILLPVLDIPSFRSKYSRLQELFSSPLVFTSHHANDLVRPQSVCLLYAVLALGALYADDGGDSSSWAAWYFHEAQETMGRLFNAVNLELVQAVMFMGAYAQHVIKPNLAYNLAGTATRMALSIGLNVDPNLTSHGWDAEEGRRTWWIIYVQEVELSVDCGRPISIRKGDLAVEYPGEDLVEDSPAHSDGSQQQVATFVRYLAGIAQITHRILKLVAVPGNSAEPTIFGQDRIKSFDELLHQWLTSVPGHLCFQSTNPDWELFAPCSWTSRQRSSLLLHYNLALIVLHRHSLVKSQLMAANDFTKMSRATCSQAARILILHIHRLFEVAPSLRRWMYYCYYCLQATFVLLFRIFDEPIVDESKEFVNLCHLSVDIFRSIELKAAHHCADVVARLLARWHERRDENDDRNEDETSNPRRSIFNSESSPSLSQQSPIPASYAENMAPARWQQQEVFVNPVGSPDRNLWQSGAQIRTLPPQQDMFERVSGNSNVEGPLAVESNFGDWGKPMHDDLWTYFVNPDQHSWSFQNCMNILNEPETMS